MHRSYHGFDTGKLGGCVEDAALNRKGGVIGVAGHVHVGLGDDCSLGNEADGRVQRALHATQSHQ